MTISERPATGQDAPYQLMPPLSTEERETLKADILDKGVIVPIVFDEDGNILDGHHRMELYYELVDAGHKLPPPSRQIIRELREDEKIDYVAKINLARRHLSKEERAQTFLALRQRGMTLQKIADATGVSVGTVHGALVGQPVPEFIVGADGRELPSQYKTWSTETAAVERKPEAYVILISCVTEVEQTTLLTRFIKEGLNCRAIVS